MDIRKTILLYQYSERIKSALIIAFKLLAKMATLSGEERLGAEKLMASFLDALLAEIRIAQNVGRSAHFRKAEEKIMEAIGKIQLFDYTEIRGCLSEALSSVTTSCQEVMDSLEKRNLL